MPGRARPEDQGRILEDVLARAALAAPRGVVVFDLDSTLLDNRPRQARILRDYGRAAGLAALRRARAEDVHGWSLEAALRALGLGAAEVARHRGPVRAFWAERFFTSAYCRLDVPLPGAPEYVRAVAARGARIVYLTGRPRAMEAGTLEVLRRHAFPPPDGRGTHLLLMKPRPDLGDSEWKALARPRIARAGPVVAAFDNEPAHVNGHAQAWPGARCVHLDTDHSPRAVAVHPAIPSIRDFRVERAAALSASAP